MIVGVELVEHLLAAITQRLCQLGSMPADARSVVAASEL
jgi:hypothetical protein